MTTEYELPLHKSVKQKYAHNLKLPLTLKGLLPRQPENCHFANINSIPLQKMKLSDVKLTEMKGHKSNSDSLGKPWCLLVTSPMCHMGM